MTGRKVSATPVGITSRILRGEDEFVREDGREGRFVLNQEGGQGRFMGCVSRVARGGE